MNRLDELLSAYLDQTLKGEDLARVERLVANDHEARERLAALRRANDLAARVLGRIDPRPMPADLMRLLADDAPTHSTAPNVVSFPEHRRRRRPLSAIAAACAAALVCGIALTSLVNGPERKLSADGLLTSAPFGKGHPLFDVYEHAASGVEVALIGGRDATARPMLSFQDREGSYCRQVDFRVADEARTALACKSEATWRLVATAKAHVAGGETYAPASSSTPSNIDAVIDESIRGAPLDAQGEASAIAGGWRNVGG